MKMKIHPVNQPSVRLVVVGSIGLDTIATPAASCRDVLGGSVSYACVAGSFFTRVGLVGVVGTDFPGRHLRMFRRCGIDLQGLQQVRGRTFRWSGVYEWNMNHRRTLSTHLNVFASFAPELPPAYRNSPFLFLANIAPELQLHVLSQVRKPRLVAADTMDLWINTARPALRRLISRVHMLLLNDSEARELTGEDHLIKAARIILTWGPRYVVIKKGEHGSMLFSGRQVYLAPAYPVDEVHDPTGAGDAFAGGLMGYLAGRSRLDQATVCRAIRYGSVVASLAVESFSLGRLLRSSRAEVEKRAREFLRMVAP